MTWFMVAVVVVVVAAGLLRWRRPAWYWLTFGVVLATVRVPGDEDLARVDFGLSRTGDDRVVRVAEEQHQDCAHQGDGQAGGGDAGGFMNPWASRLVVAARWWSVGGSRRWDCLVQ